MNEEHFTFHLQYKHSGTLDIRPAQRSNNLKGPWLDYNFKMTKTATTTTTTTIIIIIIIIIMIIILRGFVCIFFSSLKSSSLITKVETRPTSNAKSVIP